MVSQYSDNVVALSAPHVRCRPTGGGVCPALIARSLINHQRQLRSDMALRRRVGFISKMSDTRLIS